MAVQASDLWISNSLFCHFLLWIRLAHWHGKAGRRTHSISKEKGTLSPTGMTWGTPACAPRPPFMGGHKEYIDRSPVQRS